MERILKVDNMHTSFYTSNGEVTAVRGVSFELEKGEILGVVGESGSGKSVTCMSILRLLADSAKVKKGQVLFKDRDLLKMSKKEMRTVRGNEISMIFQDPMSSLNPLMSVGKQVAEMMQIHKPSMSKRELKEEVIKLFEMVRIPEASSRFKSYPHEFSGGMRQRVMIAIAIACKPDILIADEPTTALDVTIQDQILKSLRQLKEQMGMSIIFITHDLGVVAELCSRVIVMYGGMIMEEALIDDLYESPMHPYTMGLLKSLPSLNQDRNMKLDPILGSPPDMLNPPTGCPFSPRCMYAKNICGRALPEMEAISENHKSRCWLLSEEANFSDNPFIEYVQNKREKKGEL